MPQPYPEPDLSTLTSMWRYANTVTEHWITVGFLILLPIALFMLFKKTDWRTSDSLSISFFLTLILATLLWGIDLVEGKILGLLLAALAFSILYSVVDTD